MIKIKKVRNISKSLRFDVFQRDGHTCQYCGRKPPDVELEIDHLLPVAEGGTDEFDNLVTSCFDCNRGKSAKIIQDHTGGYSKDEWRDIIKEKRQETLQARREQLEEVITYWADCRGTSRPSNYDLEGIYTFIEKYDPEWIKAAIHIAAQRSPSNYVKYVAGILRNWGENGPPDYISNPDLALERKKATQKQKDYIKALLENLGLKLEDFYHKTDYAELSMLDARNLIEALTESQFQDSNGN
jgi:DnaD/phage-associated family protein